MKLHIYALKNLFEFHLFVCIALPGLLRWPIRVICSLTGKLLLWKVN